MDWFKELYDEFRMKHGFGAIPEQRTAREVDFLVEELALQERSKVLDLFCGTGRHCVELAKRGIQSVGVDSNPDYLAVARDKAHAASVNVEFVQGDVRSVDFGKDYDAVIIMYQSFGYFTDAEDRDVLRRAYEALKPGGRFFIEILNRDNLLQNWQADSEKEVDRVKVVEERTFDVLTSRINAKITRYGGERPVVRAVSWRMYSAHEIKWILEEVGFSFLAGYANLNRAPLTLETRMMRLVFVKPRAEKP